MCVPPSPPHNFLPPPPPTHTPPTQLSCFLHVPSRKRRMPPAPPPPSPSKTTKIDTLLFSLSPTHTQTHTYTPRIIRRNKQKNDKRHKTTTSNKLVRSQHNNKVLPTTIATAKGLWCLHSLLLPLNLTYPPPYFPLSLLFLLSTIYLHNLCGGKEKKTAPRVFVCLFDCFVFFSCLVSRVFLLFQKKKRKQSIFCVVIVGYFFLSFSLSLSLSLSPLLSRRF